MAKGIDVSASYINLMERNQRPVSADVLVRLAQVYDFDVSALSDTTQDDLFAALSAAVTDPLFQKEGVTREDAHELATGNPTLAAAVTNLYRAWKKAEDDLLETRLAGRIEGEEADPVEETRSFIQRHGNYFAPLDEAGEAIANTLFEGGETKGASLFDALADRMQVRHGVRVRLLPHDVMAGAYRRLNRHSQELSLSERLDQASRTFHLAHQIALLELTKQLDACVENETFKSDVARRLTRTTLANYAAAAIMTPYGPFMSAVRSLRYDVEALARRFGASFEQIAHRLTTLQRPGDAGVPFFFIRLDAAGNVSKRYSGDVFPFARYGGSCPLWNVHETFRAPRRVLTQVLELPDGAKFFSIARTVRTESSGYGAPQVERAVALGCQLDHADALVYADDLNLDRPTPIGVTCRLCERADCAARAHPPLRRRLIIDEHRRYETPFSFEFD